MKEFHLQATNLTKYFIRGRYIFSNISVELRNSRIIGIAGENGSGKTTLLKILSGIIPPSSGSIDFSIDSEKHGRERISKHLGFVSPYLTLYEEFSPNEHFHILSKLKGRKFDDSRIKELLEVFKLTTRKDEQIKTFSSGMKQRVKYISALIADPEILFLDEPFTNLDIPGIDSVKEIIEEHKKNGGGIIIASNDEREKDLCENIITVKS